MKNFWDYQVITLAITTVVLSMALTSCAKQPVVESRPGVNPNVSKNDIVQPRSSSTLLAEKNDTSAWETYHNEQNKFSFRHPSNWKLTDKTELKDDLVFVGEKPEKNFGSGTMMLRVKVDADAGNLSEIEWLQRNYPGRYFESGTKEINGIFWHIFDPTGNDGFPYAPYFPFVIANIGKVIFLFEPGYYSQVATELENVLHSARFGSWFTARLTPFKPYGSPIDIVGWQSATFEEFNLTFRYPSELRPLRFVDTTSSSAYAHGKIYSGGWPDNKITFSLFTDDYGLDYAEGSQPYFRPFSLDVPEESFRALSQGYSFFGLSVFKLTSLNEVKVLRAFEMRGYGFTYNLAATYFVPHIRKNLNLYVIVNLNEPVEFDELAVESRGWLYFSEEELGALLNDPKILNRIAVAEQILRNISSVEMVQ